MEGCYSWGSILTPTVDHKNAPDIKSLLFKKMHLCASFPRAFLSFIRLSLDYHSARRCQWGWGPGAPPTEGTAGWWSCQPSSSWASPPPSTRTPASSSWISRVTSGSWPAPPHGSPPPPSACSTSQVNRHKGFCSLKSFVLFKLKNAL